MTTAHTAGLPRAGADLTVSRSPSLWSRASDRLNPILVREVQQAVKGRVFPLTILIALAISVVIALVVASEYARNRTGRQAFNAGFATLVPLLTFVIPMQAYQSMRTELRGGIVEQLLLSRLSPGSVLFGKLQAAMVQFVLYVSVMSPLLATSYLLRGVDLVTIAISLVFALIVCVAATAFAVSSAAQAVAPALQGIANLGIAFGLGIATFGLVGFVGSGGYALAVGALMRSSQFAMVFSAIVLVAVIATVLSWLAARSFLLHAFENKSTGFRVFLFTWPVLAYGWMLLFVDRAYWDEAFPSLSFALLLVGIVFGVFMVTEQQRLSPRVRAHVPMTKLSALLAAPFLPGRDRGMLAFLLYGGLLLGIALLFWPRLVGISPYSASNLFAGVGPMALAYGTVYLGLGRWLRHRLPETVQGNQAGRVLLPVMLFLCCVLPLLVDVFVRGEVDQWHLGHVMDPFFTIPHFIESNTWRDALPVVTIVILCAALLQVATGVRGTREVVAASGERRKRQRASGAVASGAGSDAQADASVAVDE